MTGSKTLGDQYREARLAAASSNEKLATHAGAAEVLEVGSPETIGRWERDETVPSNYNVRRMAQVYRAPELITNYCAEQCPLGKGRVPRAENRPLEQVAIRFFGATEDISEDAKTLLMIAANGSVDEHEIESFRKIVKRLGGLKAAIHALQIYTEKNGMDV
ncbi:MAG: hypothetical protein PHS57_06060 [Alphaproteobacteria bacterium]|nr:hypothetical protein [Alphaproteobacteria bacterium]